MRASVAIMRISGRKLCQRKVMPCLPQIRRPKPIDMASICVQSVAMAAPATPIGGTGPQPKMNSGIEHKIQNHRAQHDEHRRIDGAQAAHQRLIGEEAEYENET